MRNLLEMIYEYQLLRSMEQNLAIPLDDSERVRLMGAYRMLQGETPDSRMRDFARVRIPIPCQFTRPGGFEAGEIRDLSGGGFGIATRRPPEVGTRVIVRLEDGATEYVFPCIVRWVSMRGPGRMGVELDGVPHRSDFFEGESTGVWRRTVTFGDAPAEPMVA